MVFGGLGMWREARAQEELKVIIDQLAFQHITTDVTIPRHSAWA